jgi:hypothetical protein
MAPEPVTSGKTTHALIDSIVIREHHGLKARARNLKLAVAFHKDEV